jgi:hypothetical protein
MFGWGVLSMGVGANRQGIKINVAGKVVWHNKGIVWP